MSKNVAGSLWAILKMGLVKFFFLLMKSLRSEHHTCTFNYCGEAGEETPAEQVWPADAQVKQKQ